MYNSNYKKKVLKAYKKWRTTTQLQNKTKKKEKMTDLIQ